MDSQISLRLPLLRKRCPSRFLSFTPPGTENIVMTNNEPKRLSNLVIREQSDQTASGLLAIEEFDHPGGFSGGAVCCVGVSSWISISRTEYQRGGGMVEVMSHLEFSNPSVLMKW